MFNGPSAKVVERATALLRAAPDQVIRFMASPFGAYTP